MNSLAEDFKNWTNATADLKYGEQRIFHDVLTLVSEDKKHDLIFGADYRGGGVCLVNAAGALLSTGGGQGIPTANFAKVVSLYDRINAELGRQGVNTNGVVSPLAAEILLRHFAPLKPEPSTEDLQKAQTEAFANGEIFIEPDDDDMKQAFLDMLNSHPPIVEHTEPLIETPFDEVKVELPTDQ